MTDSQATAAMVLENEVANVTLDSIGEAVLRADVQGKVTYLNRKAEEMTGWRREEARGRPMADVLRLMESVDGPAAGNAAGMAMQEDLAAKESADGTHRILVRRDGFECGIERKVTAIQDQDGTVTGVVVAFHDVSAAQANRSKCRT
jgi:PAS domain S-box-containing protein